MSDMKLSFDQW
jgi:hypothetical protein